MNRPKQIPDDLLSNSLTYREKLALTLSRYKDLDLAKKRLTYYRWAATEELEKSLFEFETQCNKRGRGFVHWAPGLKDAADLIENLTQNTQHIFYENDDLCNEIRIAAFPNAKPATTEWDFKGLSVFVAEAKFMLSRSGRSLILPSSMNTVEKLSHANKVIIIGSIDRMLSHRFELNLAKTLYASFENGEIRYPIELLLNTGKKWKNQGDVHIIILDNGRSNLLQNTDFRELFYLLNFKFPNVNPVDIIQNTPGKVISDFINSFFSNQPNPGSSQIIYNGLLEMQRYVPYDVDMYDLVIQARTQYMKDKKRNPISKLIKPIKGDILLTSKKFHNPQKFKAFCEKYILGKHLKLQSFERTFTDEVAYRKRKII